MASCESNGGPGEDPESHVVLRQEPGHAVRVPKWAGHCCKAAAQGRDKSGGHGGARQ